MHKRARGMRPSLVAMVWGLAFVVAACDGNTATSPTETTTTATVTVAEPSTTEAFNDVLPVGSAKLYSYTVTAYGTVNITLTSVSGAFVPATVQVGLGVGTPAGTDCATTSSLTVSASETAQITGTYDAGIYCVRIADIGNLFAPAMFAITIAHP